MAKRGLDQETIREAAVRLVEEKGYDHFSLRELATRLGVQPASLYNHVSGVEEINVLVGTYAASQLKREIETAIRGKDNEQAFVDGVYAYVAYAKANPEVYKALIRLHASENAEIRHAAYDSYAPLRDVIRSFFDNDVSTMHFSRTLRCFMHGYVELTENGFMQAGTVPKEETFALVVNNMLACLRAGRSG